MRDTIREQAAGPVKMALILDDDAAGSGALRRTLDALGYQVGVMTNANAALDALRASEEPVAVFFDVEAYEATLDGRGYAFLIGALLEDPELAHRHIFAVISSTADDVEWTLGKALDRLDAPVFSKPCSASALETFLIVAHGRVVPTPLPEVTTI